MDLGIWGRRLAALLTGALALGLLIEVLGGLVAPEIVRSILQERLQGALRRPVLIDRVTVDPFSATVSLSDVRVAGDGALPLLSVSHLVADVQLPASLLRRALIVRSLRVEGVSLRMAAGARPSDAALAALWPSRFSASNVEVRDARADIDDVGGERHTVVAARLDVPFVGNVPSPVEPTVAPAFFGRIDGVPLEIQGRARAFATGVELAAEVHAAALPLAAVLGVLPVPAAVARAVRSGRLTGDGRLVFAHDRQGHARAAASGTVLIDDVTWSGAAGLPAGAAAHVSADVESADLAAGAFVLARLTVVRPTLVVPAGGGPARAPTLGPARPRFALRLDRLTVAGARLLMEDRAAPGGLVTLADACTLEAWGLSTDPVQPLTAGFACALGPGWSAGPEPARVSGTAEGTLSPLRLAGVARARKLGAAALLPRAGLALAATTALDGAVDLRTRFQLTAAPDGPGAGPGLRLALHDISASARRLSWRMRATGEPLAAVSALAVRDGRFDSADGRLLIEEISARDAWLLGTRRGGDGLDLPDLIGASAPALRVLVEHVTVERAHVELRDRAVSPPAVIVIDDAAVEGAALSNEPDVEGVLALRGRTAGGAELTADVRLAPPPARAGLRIRLQGPSREALGRRLEALLPVEPAAAPSRRPVAAAAARP
jgi:hypothetical protein